MGNLFAIDRLKTQLKAHSFRNAQKHRTGIRKCETSMHESSGMRGLLSISVPLTSPIAIIPGYHSFNEPAIQYNCEEGLS